MSKKRKANSYSKKSQLRKLMKQFTMLRREILKDSECKKCGKCCNTYKIKLTQKDLDREPQLVENVVPMSDFQKNAYKTEKGMEYIGRLKTINNGYQCVFYDKDIGCKIHSTKPDECKAYTPSIAHCKGTEIRKYLLLEEYFNHYQKEFSKNIKLCSIEEKIKRIDELTNVFIIPFLVTFSHDKNGEILIKPNNKEKIPDFIKECLEMDGKYQLVKDLNIDLS